MKSSAECSIREFYKDFLSLNASNLVKEVYYSKIAWKTIKSIICANKFIDGMNYVKGLFGATGVQCMTFVIDESHMNPISICKDFVMKTYY